jgi:hypothetical protein
MAPSPNQKSDAAFGHGCDAVRADARVMFDDRGDAANYQARLAELREMLASEE